MSLGLRSVFNHKTSVGKTRIDEDSQTKSHSLGSRRGKSEKLRVTINDPSSGLVFARSPVGSGRDRFNLRLSSASTPKGLSQSISPARDAFSASPTGIGTNVTIADLYRDQIRAEKHKMPDLNALKKLLHDLGSETITSEVILQYLERKGMLNSAANMGFNEAKIRKMIDEADYNKNGFLSIDELSKAISGRFNRRQHSGDWLKLFEVLSRGQVVFQARAFAKPTKLHGVTLSTFSPQQRRDTSIHGLYDQPVRKRAKDPVFDNLNLSASRTLQTSRSFGNLIAAQALSKSLSAVHEEEEQENDIDSSFDSLSPQKSGRTMPRPGSALNAVAAERGRKDVADAGRLVESAINAMVKVAPGSSNHGSSRAASATKVAGLSAEEVFPDFFMSPRNERGEEKRSAGEKTEEEKEEREGQEERVDEGQEIFDWDTHIREISEENIPEQRKKGAAYFSFGARRAFERLARIQSEKDGKKGKKQRPASASTVPTTPLRGEKGTSRMTVKEYGESLKQVKTRVPRLRIDAQKVVSDAQSDDEESLPSPPSNLSSLDYYRAQKLRGKVIAERLEKQEQKKLAAREVKQTKRDIAVKDKFGKFITAVGLMPNWEARMKAAQQRHEDAPYKDPSRFMFRELESTKQLNKPDFVVVAPRKKEFAKGLPSEGGDYRPLEVLLREGGKMRGEGPGLYGRWTTHIHLPDKDHELGTGKRFELLEKDPFDSQTDQKAQSTAADTRPMILTFKRLRKTDREELGDV